MTNRQGLYILGGAALAWLLFKKKKPSLPEPTPAPADTGLPVYGGNTESGREVLRSTQSTVAPAPTVAPNPNALEVAPGDVLVFPSPSAASGGGLVAQAPTPVLAPAVTVGDASGGTTAPTQSATQSVGVPPVSVGNVSLGIQPLAPYVTPESGSTLAPITTAPAPSSSPGIPIVVAPLAPAPTAPVYVPPSSTVTRAIALEVGTRMTQISGGTRLAVSFE